MTKYLKPTLQNIKRNICIEARRELKFLKKTMLREEKPDDWGVFKEKSLSISRLLAKIPTVLPDENEQNYLETRSKQKTWRKVCME